MRRPMLALLLLAGNTFAGPNTQPAEMARFDGDVVVRVQPRDQADLQLMDQLSDDPWTCGTSASGAIDYRVDVNTSEQQSADKLAMNDIARVSFRLAQPLFIDRYAENRATGAFIVIDESTNNTVGAGMIV